MLSEPFLAVGTRVAGLLYALCSWRRLAAEGLSLLLRGSMQGPTVGEGRGQHLVGAAWNSCPSVPVATRPAGAGLGCAACWAVAMVWDFLGVVWRAGPAWVAPLGLQVVRPVGSGLEST